MVGFSFNRCQVKQPNKTTNRNLNFQVMSCETFPPYQCLSPTPFCWVHIISSFRVGADTVLHTGEKVCRGSHDLDLMCQGPWIHLPTPLTHTLPNKRCIWQHTSWMGVESAWKHHQAIWHVLISQSLCYFDRKTTKGDQLSMWVPPNNDLRSYGEYGLKKIRSKEFQAWTP